MIPQGQISTNLFGLPRIQVGGQSLVPPDQASSSMEAAKRSKLMRDDILSNRKMSSFKMQSPYNQMQKINFNKEAFQTKLAQQRMMFNDSEKELRTEEKINSVYKKRDPLK